MKHGPNTPSLGGPSGGRPAGGGGADRAGRAGRADPDPDPDPDPDAREDGDGPRDLEALAFAMMERKRAGEEVHPEALGGLVESRRESGSSKGGASRKGLGSWYTHAALARAVADWVLGPLLELADALRSDPRNPLVALPTVCDPTMGGGAFLLAAFRRILDASGAQAAKDFRIRREVAERCLFGIDLDPLAVRAARLAIWVEIGDDAVLPDQLSLNFRVADAIRSVRPRVARGPGEDVLTDFAELFPSVFGAPCAALDHRREHSPDRGPDRSLGRRQDPRRAAGAGFDAVLGNPPWDIKKPNSREFFAAYDDGFRGRERRDAETVRGQILERSPEAAAAWKAHQQEHKEFSRWISSTAHYGLQGGGDKNSYKPVLERALDLLRPGGRLGLIVPSGIYADKGCEALRRHLIESHRLERVFGFENRDGIFDIHRSFRFAAVVVEKGATTGTIQVAIGQTALDGLVEPDRVSIDYPREDVAGLSPKHFQLLELKDDAERALLHRLHYGRRRIGDLLESGLRYKREFDLTQDARHFVEHARLVSARADFDASGVATVSVAAHGGPGPGRYLPLLQGVMLRSFDCPAAAWRGQERTGGAADWRVSPPSADRKLIARIYVEEGLVRERSAASLFPRLAFRDVQNATNERTFLGAIAPGFPCGNTLPTLSFGDLRQDLELLAVLTSFVVDRVLRLKMSQNHVNRFLVEELPVPDPPPEIGRWLVRLAASLAMIGPWFEDARRSLGMGPLDLIEDPAERVRTRALLDALVARSFGLGAGDLEILLADCAHPVATLGSAAFRRGLDRKGFWRVDRDQEPENRHPVAAVQSLKHLETLLAAGIPLDHAVHRIAPSQDGGG